MVHGRFEIQEGNIIFTGHKSPRWASDAVLNDLGITTGFGTGDIDPFKMYTLEEFYDTPFWWYHHGVQGWSLKGSVAKFEKEEILKN